MTGLYVYAAGSDNWGTIVAGSGITRRNIGTNYGRRSCVCSTWWGPALNLEPTSRVSSTAVARAIMEVTSGSLGPSRAASEVCQVTVLSKSRPSNDE